ncbi:hypothetical protein AN948_01490 [Rhodococcus sp. ADH]|uniref:CHAT domain-containing protein n=1 Tax=Rhodococcus sp. ADH TaxID=224843 RepID=UPI0006BA2FAD|nr:CHAT domain-containing protein [Rhodococcus sp. ADH]KPH21466.1 hypothetical protein AN948_01490 [Rhodococcus sp. ADH]
MGATQTRGQLIRKREQRIEADKKAGEHRSKESAKRSDASKARIAAGKATTASTIKSKLHDADRNEEAANKAGKEATTWQRKADGYRKEESTLEQRLTREEKSEATTAENNRKREADKAARAQATERADYERRIAELTTIAEQARTVATGIARELRNPKQEKLRILMLGADSDGTNEGSYGLRIGREQSRIRSAVKAALHRDLIEFDARPAATAEDLLDGMSSFRPHIVHFSGHSDHDVVLFEADTDTAHTPIFVTAEAFAAAVAATDDPPQLVILNSCNSASQIDALVATVAPFAIGMADEIEDSDAITYAARFYASIANGQSIHSSHAAGRAALQLAGLDGAELPTLACSPDVDPSTAVLVVPIK